MGSKTGYSPGAQRHFAFGCLHRRAGGRGRLLSDGRPTQYFAFAGQPEQVPFYPLIGLSGQRGGPMLLMKNGDLVSMGQWPLDRQSPQLALPDRHHGFDPLFVSIDDTYAVASGGGGEGYYFTSEWLLPEQLSRQLQGAFRP